MKESIVPGETVAVSRRSPGPVERAARRLFFAGLRKLSCGEITVEHDGRSETFGAVVVELPVRARITILDPRFFMYAAFGGSNGAAEAYIRGFWRCDTLTALIRIMVRNMQVSWRMESGAARIMTPVNRLFHFLHRNTRRGSRINIAAHYDLGNDFYRLFLDGTMTYSSAVFEREGASLEEAQIAKYDRICRALGLSADDRVLEIGCGWGGFGLHAASKYGCRVTGTTISRNQYEYAREAVRAAGLEDRVEILFEDYRDLKGLYDRLVSIEMIEAVGRENYDGFFRICSERLKPEGMMGLQAITISEYAFERQTRTVDFIKRYIFPGSCIPSVSAMMGSVARATDLRLVRLEDITPHYARTLRAWRENFFARIAEVRALGLPESFIRMWEYYLCYCEGGFEERYIGDVQMIFAKPLCRGPVRAPRRAP